MNIESGMVIGAIFIGCAGFVISLLCLVNNRRNKSLVDALMDQIDEIESEFAEFRELHEDGNLRSTDHSRRIAWLETRIRKPERLKKADLDHETVPKSLGSNMTERRHRVLTLAKRGQDATTIASALGMLIGEVELIMSLGRGTDNFA